MFDEVFGIVPESPYEGPYGMEPLDYGRAAIPVPAANKPENKEAEKKDIIKNPEGTEGPEYPLGGREGPEGGKDPQLDESLDYDDDVSDERTREKLSYRLLEASGDEDLAKSFADAIFSLYREDRGIVFAFDNYLGNGRSKKAIELLDVINDLKSDRRYSGFLNNVEVMRFDPARGMKSVKERVEAGDLVFTFARNTQETRQNLADVEDAPNLMLSYIDEREILTLLDFGEIYYPLFEVVTISLSMYVDRMTLDDIAAIEEGLAIKASRQGRAMVFMILPTIKRFDTRQEMIRYYALKRKMLIAA